jgi:phage tail protein X
MMANTYTTIQGDTWDLIAYRTLGSEYLLPLLLDANTQYRSTVIFSGGITLTIPDVDTSEVTDRPDWLGEDDEDDVSDDDLTEDEEL